MAKKTPAEQSREWRAKNPERARAIMRRWRANNLEKARRTAREWNAEHKHIIQHHSRSKQLRKYGLTWEDYARMYEAQEGRCAICGKAEDGSLSVDHDHATNTIRGLLCRLCNKGLGIFKDSQLLLQSAQSYLMRSA